MTNVRVRLENPQYGLQDVGPSHTVARASQEVFVNLQLPYQPQEPAY